MFPGDDEVHGLYDSHRPKMYPIWSSESLHLSSYPCYGILFVSELKPRINVVIHSPWHCFPLLSTSIPRQVPLKVTKVYFMGICNEKWIPVNIPILPFSSPNFCIQQLAGYPPSFHHVWQDISLKLSLKSIFRKFVHWALGIYYYLKDRRQASLNQSTHSFLLK